MCAVTPLQKYAGPIQVVKEDPVAHKSLPTFVWKTPEMDAAEYRNSVSWVSCAVAVPASSQRQQWDCLC